MVALQTNLIFLLILISGLSEAKQLFVYLGQGQQTVWQEAQTFCLNKGYKPVSTLNMGEHKFLGHAIRSCAALCNKGGIIHSWTAGHQEGNEKRYLWKGIEKEIDLDMGWQSGQPDNYKGNEHCIEAWVPEGRGQAFLNDRPCEDKYHVVCEKD